MYIGSELIQNYDQLLKVGNGTDYERGQLESLEASTEAMHRVLIFTALKAGVTVQELCELHDCSYPHFPTYVQKKFPGLTFPERRK